MIKMEMEDLMWRNGTSLPRIFMIKLRRPLIMSKCDSYLILHR